MFETNQKRNYQILVKLTADERRYIENASKRSGLNMSEVTRRLLKSAIQEKNKKPK